MPGLGVLLTVSLAVLVLDHGVHAQFTFGGPGGGGGVPLFGLFNR